MKNVMKKTKLLSQISLVIAVSTLLMACQTPVVKDDSAVHVIMPNGQVRVIESTIPTASQKATVRHNGRVFTVDASKPSVSSQGQVTGSFFVPSAPEGAHWQLLSIGAITVSNTAKRQPYLRMSGGLMQGLTGCNVMDGSYNRFNEKMRFIKVKGTTNVCAESQAIETGLIQAMQKLRTWRITDENHHLQFLNESGEVLAEFVALSP